MQAETTALAIEELEDSQNVLVDSFPAAQRRTLRRDCSRRHNSECVQEKHIRDHETGIRSNEAPEAPSEYIVETIVEYDAKEDRFRVRWYGYFADDDTSESPAH